MNFKLLLNRLREGDRLALSKAISMAESQLLQDRKRLKYLLEALSPTQSLRVGVTGAPGVGKSALLQVLAQHIISEKINTKHALTTKGSTTRVKNLRDSDDFKEQDIGDSNINRVAILTVDPSSSISGGSILGDKVRMSTISNNKNVFIRQSATAGHLGGVSKSTYNVIRVCESK